MSKNVPIQERTSQLFVGDYGALLIIGPGIHPDYGPYIPSWKMVELDTLRQITMSEDWVSTQEKMGNIVRL